MDDRLGEQCTEQMIGLQGHKLANCGSPHTTIVEKQTQGGGHQV